MQLQANLPSAQQLQGENVAYRAKVTSGSDIQLKTNINTIQNALDKVSKLRGVEFDYKESGRHNIGVIAQEVEEVFPDLVIGDDPKTVAYGNLTAVLIEAVKELREEVSLLKQEINTLKGKPIDNDQKPRTITFWFVHHY